MMKPYGIRKGPVFDYLRIYDSIYGIKSYEGGMEMSDNEVITENKDEEASAVTEAATSEEMTGSVPEAADPEAVKDVKADEVPGSSGFLKYLLHGVASTYLFAYLFMMFGSLFGSLMVQLPLHAMGLLTDDHPVIITAVTYLSFTGIWIVILLYILIFKKESPYLVKIIGRVTKTSTIMFILGCIIFGGLNLICILAAKGNGDIFMYFSSFDVLPFILLFISVMFQSGAEELVCRGFLYRRVFNCYGKPAVAIIANSMFFTLLHVGNPGVTLLSLLNVLLCGVFFSLIIYYTDSMAFAIAGHTGWNFCQSIICGLPSSGQVFPYSFFKLDASTARDSFFYNVGFGVEGTAFAVIVLAVSCIAVIVLGQMKILKRPENIKPLIG